MEHDPDDILARIDRLETQLDTLHQVLDAVAPAIRRRRYLYSQAASLRKKAALDFAFRLGQISNDRRRGIKAATTRLTVGWKPPRLR